jgi:HprK-related kinase A
MVLGFDLTMSRIALPASFPIAADRVASDSHAAQRVRVRHYRIGPVPVALSCEVSEVAEAFQRYYRTYEVFIPSADSFCIEVRTRRSWRSGRRYYHILANGCQQCTLDNPRSVLPFVEWTMNACVAKFLPDYLQIHAATVSRDGCGVIFAGSPGQGKSTLAAGLLARGWSYFSDEFALIHRYTHELHAYPKALCIKAGSFESVLDIGLPLDLNNVLHKGGKGLVSLIDPLAIRPDAVSQPCHVAMIVFPQYEPGSQPTIEPMSRAQAVFELVQLSFNFTKFRNKGLDLLAGIARRAICVRLRSSDLATTCALLESSLSQWRKTGRLSA